MPEKPSQSYSSLPNRPPTPQNHRFPPVQDASDSKPGASASTALRSPECCAAESGVQTLDQFEKHLKECKRLVLDLKRLQPKLFTQAHWDWVRKKLCCHEWTLLDFGRACDAINLMPRYGLDPVMLKKRHFKALMKKRDEDSHKEWEKALKKKLEELHERMQKKETLSQVKQREDREDEEAMNADAPTALIIGGYIARYNNLSVSKSWLAPFNIATGEVNPLREDPGTVTHQTRIPFPDGPQHYPNFLIGLSSVQRTSLKPPAIAFAMAAIIAQLPADLPADCRDEVIDVIKTTDLRLRPSSLPCFDRLKKAVSSKGTVSLVNILQCLAHSHWKIVSTGPYAFAHRNFVALGIDEVTDYTAHILRPSLLLAPSTIIGFSRRTSLCLS